jgi:hypothetical protein
VTYPDVSALSRRRASPLQQRLLLQHHAHVRDYRRLPRAGAGLLVLSADVLPGQGLRTALRNSATLPEPL